jgi:outer membrane protein W
MNGLNTAVALAIAAMLFAGAAQSAEPTEAQMKDALLQAAQQRGGVRSGRDSVSANNPIGGLSFTIVHFEKIGCEKAASRAGYNCDYSIAMKARAHSSEGTSAGDQHAQAMTALIGALVDNRVSTESRRFVQSGGRWVVLEN